MAAKNLDEAIRKAMTLGKASDFPVNMKNEIKDFLSREVMETLGTKPTDDETKILYKFFKKVIGE